MTRNTELEQPRTRQTAVALLVTMALCMGGLAECARVENETSATQVRPDVVTLSPLTTIAMRLVTDRLAADSPDDSDAIPMGQAIGRTPVYPGVTYRMLRTGWMSPSLEFAIAPGFNAGVITLQFAEPVAASVGKQGQLRLTTSDGEFSLASPTAFQPAVFERLPVAVSYRVCEDGTVTLQVSEFDDTLPLLIRIPLQGVPLLLPDTARSGANSAAGLLKTTR